MTIFDVFLRSNKVSKQVVEAANDRVKPQAIMGFRVDSGIKLRSDMVVIPCEKCGDDMWITPEGMDVKEKFCSGCVYKAGISVEEIIDATGSFYSEEEEDDPDDSLLS